MTDEELKAIDARYASILADPDGPAEKVLATGLHLMDHDFPALLAEVKRLRNLVEGMRMDEIERSERADRWVPAAPAAPDSSRD